LHYLVLNQSERFRERALLASEIDGACNKVTFDYQFETYDRRSTPYADRRFRDIGLPQTRAIEWTQRLARNPHGRRPPRQSVA
jgi:hypothetical protein